MNTAEILKVLVSTLLAMELVFHLQFTCHQACSVSMTEVTEVSTIFIWPLPNFAKWFLAVELGFFFWIENQTNEALRPLSCFLKMVLPGSGISFPWRRLLHDHIVGQGWTRFKNTFKNASVGSVSYGSLWQAAVCSNWTSGRYALDQ